MASPKPITVVVVDAEDYSGPAPQPFAIIGGGVPSAEEFAALVSRVEALEV